MRAKTYRVKEHDGKFTIQGLFVETKTSGLLWWTKYITTEKWSSVDINGFMYDRKEFLEMEIMSGIRLRHLEMPSFRTLEEATEMIMKIVSPPKPIYHLVDTETIKETNEK